MTATDVMSRVLCTVQAGVDPQQGRDRGVGVEVRLSTGDQQRGLGRIADASSVYHVQSGIARSAAGEPVGISP